MVDIVTCPECGRPRADGHRCPSCGDAPTTTEQQATTKDPAQSWQQPIGPAGAPSTAPSSTQARPALGETKSRGRLVGGIAAVALVVVAIVVAVVLTSGGDEVAEEEDISMAAAPALAYDLSAQAQLRNAMATFDMTIAEFGSLEEISQTTLQTMDPSTTWVQGSAGLCASPPTSANAKENSIAWVSTGPLSYELGTWSPSGVEYGVKVDAMGGGTTYYKDGQPGNW